MVVGAIVVMGFLATLAVAGWRQFRRRSIQHWLISHVAQTPRRMRTRSARETHILICVADHYEPCLGNASAERAQARVDRWVHDYPRLFEEFADSDGRPPRHTFFFPLEEYVPEHIDALGELCRQGFGEVEVHLHHDGDTAAALRTKLLWFKDVLAQRHGLLSRDRRTGELVYGFIHGNWALDNSRPDGKWCGVTNELDVLRQSGCYADFTLPSAPDPTQTRKINSLYYATGDPCRCKSHDTGIDVGAGPRPADALLLIQGPLLLDWGRRKWGLLPRIENGCIQGNQPPSLRRLQLWLRAHVQVPTRPDWFFVKLHTHGASERNQTVLLGEPMRQFHQALCDQAAAHPSFHYHYVTAREMYNLARAAEAGWAGSVSDALDYELTWNGWCSTATTDRCILGRT